MSRRAGFRAAPALLILFALALDPRPAGADPKTPPESNLALLDRALTAVARRLAAEAPIAAGSRIALVQAGESLVSKDVERAMLAALTERRMDVWMTASAGAESAHAAADTGRTVGAAAAAPGASIPGEIYDAGTGPLSVADPAAGHAPAFPVLVLGVEEARVDYPRLYRSGLFGGLHVERRATARLSARLLRPETHAVYWIGAADTSFSDNVSRSEVRVLEDPNRPETKGVVPPQSWQKAVEPVLVVALVVGLVSLFYTNRP